MRALVLFLACAALCTLTANGQTSESGTEPSLGLAFPFQQGEGQVLVKNAVLINRLCVIPAGSKARVIYVQPKEGDADVRKARKKDEDKNNAYSRVPDRLQDRDNMTPIERATYDRAIKTIWTSETAFRAALEQSQREYMRIVFQEPGSDTPKIEHFEFPQGMILSEANGQIVVVAVVIDSPAAKAGIVGNAALLSLNGQDFKGKLAEFQKIYFDEKDSAKSAGKRQLDFAVKLPKSEEPKTISIRLPMSLNTDMWSEIKK